MKYLHNKHLWLNLEIFEPMPWWMLPLWRLLGFEYIDED